MSREVYEHLTYGLEVGPVGLIREDVTLEAPEPGIASVVLRRGESLVVLSMASDVDDGQARAAAVDYVERLLDYLSLGTVLYEPPTVDLVWGSEAGRAGRSVYLRGEAVGIVTATATLERDPQQDARFMQAAPARMKLAQGWIAQLQARLRQSAEIGGAAGFIILYDAVKDAAAAATGQPVGEKAADQWMLGVLPSILTFPKPPHPNSKNPKSATESEFTRIRAELAHCQDRGVDPIDATRRAARRLVGLQEVVMKGLRRELRM